MLRLSLLVCSFTHVDTLLSFMFVLVFSTLSAFLSTFFYFEANSKKRAHFCRLPTHIHTLMPILTLTLESERRSQLTPLTYGIIMRARVSWEIRRKNSYGTRIHSRLRRQRHPLLSRTTVAACMACLFCSVVQKRRTNQNKIYRQLLTATHTNACTHAHTATHTRPTHFARHKMFCTCVLLVCVSGRHDSSTAVTLSETARYT